MQVQQQQVNSGELQLVLGAESNVEMTVKPTLDDFLSAQEISPAADLKSNSMVGDLQNEIKNLREVLEFSAATILDGPSTAPHAAQEKEKRRAVCTQDYDRLKEEAYTCTKNLYICKQELDALSLENSQLREIVADLVQERENASKLKVRTAS